MPNVYKLDSFYKPALMKCQDCGRRRHALRDLHHCYGCGQHGVLVKEIDPTLLAAFCLGGINAVLEIEPNPDI